MAMKRSELPWLDWIELAVPDQSPSGLLAQVPESLYPHVEQPSEAQVREALVFLIQQEPQEKRWGGRHPRYDREEWVDPTSSDHAADDYDWAFYERVRGDAIASQRQRDHLVSLREAHASGGCDWPQRKKWHFFSDKSNLFFVSRITNEGKSYYDPALWRPARLQAWPKYAETWIKVKKKWGLTLDPTEIAFLRWMLIAPVERRVTREP